MPTHQRFISLVIAALVPLAACRDATQPRADAAKDTAAAKDTTPSGPKPWSPRPILVTQASTPPAIRDSTVSKPDSSADTTAAVDSAGRGSRRRGYRPMVLSPADSARWPVKAPAPLPGSLLPDHRIVAFYGNVRSTRMGILGQLPRDEMLARLEETATEWAEADPGRKVMPALHLIVTVAQGKPAGGGKYRLRMGDSLVSEVARWAEERGWIMFVDVQIGLSTVEAELAPLLPILSRPYVHLALDPEFAMTKGGIPGKRIGTMDAKHVNYAIGLLASLVDSLDLPPKVLVVHRFTQPMLTNYSQIKLDPRVQVVIQMDGFGTYRHKQDAYRYFIVPEPVQFTGFKLFYKNDREPRTRQPGFAPSCPQRIYQTVGCGDDGLMTPKQVIGLWPSPLYVQYQ